MRFDQDGKLCTAMADRYTCSDDGKIYTFHIRNAKWSNGEPVTAYDFEYSWKQMLDPHSPATVASNLFSIKHAEEVLAGSIPPSHLGVYAPDAETLVVELNYPSSYFLEELTLPHFFPINRHHPDCFSQLECIGNGPFTLKKWTPQQEMELLKNPRYWDKKNVHLDEIHISFLTDINTELRLFEKGQLDWAGGPLSTGIPTHATSRLNKAGILQTRKSHQTYYYSFNLTHPLLRISQIRKALSLSIPRREITTHITAGNEEPAYHFLPKELSFLSDKEVWLSDEELVQLFNDGLEIVEPNSRQTPIVISYNNLEHHRAIAQTIQQRWKELFDADVRLRPREWKAHISEVAAGNFDVARFSWLGKNSDPYSYMELFLDPHHSMHGTSWQSLHFRKALLHSKEAESPEEALSSLALAEDLLDREDIIAPILYQNVVFVKNPQLQGFHIARFGIVDFKSAKFSTQVEER